MKTKEQNRRRRNRNRQTLKDYRYFIIAVAACILAAAVILLIPAGGNRKEPAELSEYSSVNTICELATLRSYYHNVVVYEETPDGFNKFMNDVMLWPFGSLTRIGYKQFWMEYTGIVETGVDASQIQIKGPDKNGVVEVYVPEAKVLSVASDEDTLTDPISEKGLFTTISAKEKATAFASAQKAMRQEAENDSDLLRRTEENARVLLEKYIVNTGKEIGADYTVRWVSDPS